MAPARIVFHALIAVLFAALPGRAQEPGLPEGFEHFYNLEYDEAIDFFARQVAQAPDSAPGYNHLAQSILYRQMLRAGALESELVSGTNPFLRRARMNPTLEDQKRFDESIRKAMALSEARLKKNPRDTAALYTLGVSYGLRANYNFLVRKAWYDSLRDATTARKLHNKVTELDPSNIDARLMQGIHDYVVGSLPLTYKLLGFLIGFRGDKEQGIRTLQLVGQKGNLNRYDARILLCAIYRRERRSRDALPLLDGLVERFPRNYLLRFETAQMYSDTGQKEKALAVLRRMDSLRQAKAPGFAHLAPEKIRFSEGVIQFWYNDLDQAVENLSRAVERAQDLDLNTALYAWLRLGQTYDLKGQRARAVSAYQQAIRLMPDSDPARESRRYLSSPYRRPRTGG